MTFIILFVTFEENNEFLLSVCRGSIDYVVLKICHICDNFFRRIEHNKFGR